MQTTFRKQRGFGMAAMFVAVAIAFAGSLAVKTDDGTTLASKMGLGETQTAAFASMEGTKEKAAQ